MQLFFNLSFGYPSPQKYPQPSGFCKQEKEKFRSFLRCYLITTNTKPYSVRKRKGKAKMHLFYKGKVHEAYISHVKAQLTGAKISCPCVWLVYLFDKYRG